MLLKVIIVTVKLEIKRYIRIHVSCKRLLSAWPLFQELELQKYGILSPLIGEMNLGQFF